MYKSNGNDVVLELTDLPQSSVGAPCPLVIASEHKAVICYYLQNTPADWDGSYVNVVDPNSSKEPWAIVEFKICFSHYFGSPNDEAFNGHPLAAKGLRPYRNFEIKSSSWIAQQEEMNSVHPSHNEADYLDGRRHFILAFHDSVFECVAQGYEAQLGSGSISEMAEKMTELALS